MHRNFFLEPKGRGGGQHAWASFNVNTLWIFYMELDHKNYFGLHPCSQWEPVPPPPICLFHCNLSFIYLDLGLQTIYLSRLSYPIILSPTPFPLPHPQHTHTDRPISAHTHSPTSRLLPCKEILKLIRWELMVSGLVNHLNHPQPSWLSVVGYSSFLCSLQVCYPSVGNVE